MPAEKKFQPMEKGQPPSLIQADLANEVIDHCAAVESMTIIPQGRGTFKVSGRTSVLDLTGTAADSGAVLGPIVLTLSKNGIPTDYNINGEEVV